MYPNDIIQKASHNLRRYEDAIKAAQKAQNLLQNNMYILERLPLDALQRTSQVINKVWQNTTEVIKQLDEEAIETFKYYELPIHYSMDLEFIESLVDKYKNNVSTEEINKYFSNYFDDYLLNKIQNHWNNSVFLHKRTNLFEQVISGYQYNLYGLVVTTVTTQIEGIISDKLELDKIGKFRFNEKHLNQNFKYDTLKLKIIIEAMFCVIGFSDKITRNFYIDRVVSNKNNENNRHSIAHGAIFDHLSNIHAIKAIVIFDSILSRLEEFKTKEELEDMIHRVAKNKVNN
ncbi:hypothetical protein WL766_10435 [Staphylococcus pasteuri]|nr:MULTISPECIES: hypothetical protein [Staphylococcus]ODB65171.1 hypothetical protein A9N02_05390 [Staphylococcus sp. AOAB]MCO0861654.1 hypothetical protein [Staphylococcus pasteuri]MCO5359904.1 hypothetical protein [Staphylococcus pasteuri]OFV11733.1 hypothetical protein HMPREF3125_02870 [Staphylococcus sp. HMSC13A10]QDW85562.1 hypothetical protein DWB95_11820 [Staphylococcus pasteuri]